MRSPRGRTFFRLAVVLTFVGACVAAFGFFWINAGGSIPGVYSRGDQYQVAFYTNDVGNTVEFGDVRMAGVIIGKVSELENEPAANRTKIVLNLEKQAPLHEGATVRVGIKSIIGQSYVDVVDGPGPEMESGTVLPAAAVLPAVSVTQVLDDLDPEARRALSGTIRSLGAGTDGQGRNVSAVLGGLGDIGRSGYTALDAVAAQSEDLEAVVREGARVLDALDTRRGQVAQLVGDARTITDATAGQRPALEATLRKAPGLLDSAKTATGDLNELTEHLRPIASDLKKAAPDLNDALVQLPATTQDLRGLLKPLDDVLSDVPATLERVPAVADDVRALVPPLRDVLADVNPTLAYFAPYGRDTGAMLTSFSDAISFPAENGVKPVRLAPIFNSDTYKGIPIPIRRVLDPTHWTNPYPKPGQAGNTGPFMGQYPRVEREPR